MYLPYDILSNIFSNFVVVDVDDDTNTDTVARLAGVCQQWRQIALDLPSLWTTLTMQLPTTRAVDSASLQRVHLKALFWLRNSQNEMVNIKIEYGGHGDLLLHLLAFVAPAYSRWSKVIFRGTGNGGVFQCALPSRTSPNGGIAICHPELKSVSKMEPKEVVWTRSNSTDPLIAPFPHIRLYLPPRSESSKSTPLGQLTQFTFLQLGTKNLGLSWTEVANALSSFPSLRHLIISGDFSIADNNDLSLKPVLLPSLLEIHMESFSGSDLQALFTRLSLPLLRILWVQASLITEGFHKSFSVRPPLAYLFLSRSRIPDEEFKALITTFWDLMVLRLSIIPVTEAMLGAMDPGLNLAPRKGPKSGSYPLPFLNSLVLMFAQNVSSTALTKMAINRDRASDKGLVVPMKLEVTGSELAGVDVTRLRTIYGRRLNVSM